ncbi:hypothetical protein BHM03_00061976, partial [Ensete ventricosum]
WCRLQQGYGYNRRKTGQQYTRLLRRRAAVVWSKRWLLATIKIVAGCDVNRLQRKIAAGSFLSQGSLLATIKEDGSKRPLLAALGSERCMM